MRCPKCDHKLTIEDVEANETWRKILELAPVFGGEQKLVSEYIELFGLKPLTATAKKRLRLLEEVGALFVQKKFAYQKKTYRVSESGIKEGLTVVCNKHFESPLENHNYLKKVLMAISEREQKEGRDQAEKEQRRREEFRSQEPGARAKNGGEYLSREEVARLAGQVVKNMGGR